MATVRENSSKNMEIHLFLGEVPRFPLDVFKDVKKLGSTLHLSKNENRSQSFWNQKYPQQSHRYAESS